MSRRALIYYKNNNTSKIVEEIEKVVSVDTYEVKEKDNNEISHDKINFKDYDIFIIGSPVTNNEIHSSIKTFINKFNNYFVEKTIIPFITTQDITGDSLNEMKNLFNGAHIKNEMDIKFNEDNLDTNLVGLTDWIDSL